MARKSDYAILFLNLGGPEKREDVQAFLYNLFKDPEIMRIGYTPLRNLIAWFISVAREKKSQRLYQSIGGGSPIRRLTDAQSKAVETKLEEAGHPAYVRTAFTCSPPFVESVIKGLYDIGVRNFLAFPLYPQYSFTTTKSALDRVRIFIRTKCRGSKLIEIRSWPDHPGFVQSHVELIQASIDRLESHDPMKTHLLFSAHSIPEKLVTELGDPYKNEVQKSVYAIVRALNWKGPWHLSWQSKVGPMAWLSPSTKDTIKKLGKDGVKTILVDPIAFVTDHIETLEEIDKELKALAKYCGIHEFRRVKALNNHPTFIQALTDLALSQKSFWNG